MQLSERAGFPPGDAREDWAILRALSDVLGHKLPYDSLSALRQTLFAAHPHMMRIDQIAAGASADIGKLAGLGGSADKAPLHSASRTSISPIRSRALPPSWPNVRLWPKARLRRAAE